MSDSNGEEAGRGGGLLCFHGHDSRMRGVHWLLSHVPYWAVKTLALVGGVGTLIQWGGKVIVHLRDTFYAKYDERVWAILRDEPKFKQTGTASDKPMYDRNIDAPFQPSELASQLKRSEHMVKGSLHRLEKRGKIKEIRGGWVRRDKL